MRSPWPKWNAWLWPLFALAPCPLPQLSVRVVTHDTGVRAWISDHRVYVQYPDGQVSDFARSDRRLRQFKFDWPPSWADTEKLQGKKVLDVGCGSGGLVQDLIDRGVQAEGLEIVLSDEERKSGVGPHLRERDARSTGYEDGRFDYVYASYTVFTFEQNPEVWTQTLNELVRITRKGGKIRLGPVSDDRLRGLISANPQLKLLGSSRTYLEIERLP